MLQSGQCAERERIEHNLRAGHLLMLTYDMETLLFENIGSFVIGLTTCIWYSLQPSLAQRYTHKVCTRSTFRSVHSECAHAELPRT